MAKFVGAMLLDEVQSFRRRLINERITPLAREAEQVGSTEGARHWLHFELAKQRYKLSLVDHFIELFRLHDAGALTATIARELGGVRRARFANVGDDQVAAVSRVRLRTVAIERQIGCVYATHLLVETDGLRIVDADVSPIEFEVLDGKFGGCFAAWERHVATAMATFCRTHTGEDDRRLRLALADYVASVRATTWPRAAATQERSARTSSMPFEPTPAAA